MTKSKVQEVAREVGESANALLGGVGRARQGAQQYVGSLIDIEQRLLAEAARREEEARLAREEEQRTREIDEIRAEEEAQEAAIRAAILAAREQDRQGAARGAGAVPQAAAPVQTPAQEPEEPVKAPAPEAAQAPGAASLAQPERQMEAPEPRPAPAPAPRPPLDGQARPAPRAPLPPRPGPRPFIPHPDDPNAAVNRAKFAAQGGVPAQNRPPMQQQGQAPRPGFGGQGPRPGFGGQGPRPGFGGQSPRPGFGGQAPRPAGAPGAPARPGGFGGGGAGRPGFGNRNKGPELTPTQEKEKVSNYDPNRSTYQRVFDPENKAIKSRRDIMKENIAKSGGLDDEHFKGKKRRGKQMMRPKIEPIKIEKAFMTADTITVKDLTERLGKPAGEIIKKLLLLGIMATINQELDYDTALLVAQEFGIELVLKLEKTAEDALEEEQLDENPEDQLRRPPVVAVMGHVDHGKTSLLDAIRATSVTAQEAGGITQHIGAYTVMVDGRQITFLDTPGHEAFTSMRMRGGQAADIVILVVAADDGIMPQTVEAISHAKAADVAIVVAINKMDKPDANPDRIKQELTEYGLVAEEWGGDTTIVPVSALAKDGIDHLLEMVLLTADMRELTANPNRQARGVIIEAQLDKGRGPVATVLVQNGTLRVGDTIVAGTAYGRVRAMVNDKGQRVTEAGPSTPVEVIGFSDVPDAGETMNAAQDDKLSRLVAEERRDKLKVQQLKTMSKASLDDLFSRMQSGEVKDLNLVIKADVQGSVEAVRQAMEKLSNEEVRVRCVHGGVGAITASDVMLASVANAIIIGFNVRPDNQARESAEKEKVDIRLYRVIYHATEEIEAAMKGMLKPQFKETVLGAAQVRQAFRVTGVGTIAGSYVTSGDIRRNAQARLIRDGVVVYESKIESLKRFKDDAREVHQGYECGIGLENYNDIKEGDVIECFLIEEIAR